MSSAAPAAVNTTAVDASPLPPAPDTPGNRAEAYRAKRRRQMLARKRGPFIRDTAAPEEFPIRARAAAYRMLNTEVAEETISAHHLIEFRKYVDSLLADAQTSEVSGSLHETNLDEVVRQQEWWSLPRVERWLSERVKAWAQPIKQESSSAASPIRRACHVSAYGAKGTRKSMEDYLCTYLHWGNLFGGGNASASLPLAETDERALSDALAAATGDERERLLKLWAGQNSARFVGVFDGHGGSECAAYVCDQLPQAIITSEHFPHDIEQACVSSFKAINAAFLERANQVECDAGTTALIMFTWGRKMYTANVGDCQAVLAVHDAPAELLTLAHNPYNPAEAAAVEKRGGCIQEYRGKLRVDGVVSITRGFGCRPASLHTSCIPDVFTRDITPADDFVIIASDGLWDVMTSQEAVDFVRAARDTLLAATSDTPAFPLKELAAQLCAHAIKLGSNDNVTTIVAMFDHAG